MSDTKWTSGPWRLDCGRIVSSSTTGFVIIAEMYGTTNNSQVLADAHMIAAAPKLYEALEISTDNIETLAIRLDKEPGNQIVVGAMMHRVQVNRAALARARGDGEKT